ncbi:MAG TPA: hypothetical protein VM582_01515, partial [Candidatus Thermoplasmatota archaeon]|nr:hypothetical protein [Candidatus Thermoplasmatota archaeon]
AYGRYDGTFRDNVVFLYFIGGMAMGALLGFLSLLSFVVLQNQLIAVVLIALLLPIAVTVGINRRKWQGERHAVFNGGAFGLGIAVMMAFTYLYRFHLDVDWPTIVRSLLLAAGFAGLFFGLGLLAGNSVRLRKPLRFAFLGTAIILAPVIFLGVYTQQQLWTFPALIAAYGGVFAFAAERRILIEGVTDEARKMRRRRRRKAMMER